MRSKPRTNSFSRFPARAMKLRLLIGGLLLLTCPHLLLAQQPLDLSRQALDDPALAPTGILLDRVVPMSRIQDHDGRETTTPVTLSAWRQMLHELTRASLPEPTWPGVERIRAESRLVPDPGPVPIAILNIPYNRIDPNALERGLLVRSDDGLVVAEGASLDEFVWQSRAFAATALRRTTHHGEHIDFVLSQRLLFGNTPQSVTGIEIDLDDGSGFHPAQFEQRITARYGSTGRKIIRLRLQLAGGELLHTSFVFDVLALRTPLPHETWSVTATIPYLGGYGTGSAYIYLADGHTTLTDPVVVAEGFDLDNTMGWEELYTLLNQENLVEDLRSEGFDAVVLDFTESTDYMQRNALMMVELIQQIQAAQVDDQDLVVIGASMGGLVARYALAYMETEGMDHRTRAFISFDGPHNGANIPLGLQYWLQLFQIESTDAAYLLSRLDTPASRQMLLYHHTDPPGATGQHDALRDDFLADIATLGDYPATPRKVAVANGSGHMANQGFAPGEQLISYEYSSFLVDIIGNVWAVPDGTSQLIFDGLIDRIWPLADDQLVVTVSGTLPFDNAPGGHRASMAQMDTTAVPYGDIVALHDSHCFIPTISALALDTANPFYDIAGDPDLLSSTPFDVVYYPVENQEHVAITTESRGWFLDEIRRDLSVVPAPTTPFATTALFRGIQPNPFNPRVTIRYQLVSPARVSLSIYDLAGRAVRDLVDGDLVPSGEYTATWDGRDRHGRDLASGTYLCRLEAGSGVLTRKMILAR